MKREARIAVLQYYASEMQGYKLNILTLAVGLLGAIELWSRVYCFLPLKPVWALGFGSFSGATFYCLIRIAFFGKFVELSYTADTVSGNWPMLNSVRRGTEMVVDNYLKCRSKTWPSKFWKRMIRWGKSASAGLLPSAVVSIIVAVPAVFWFPSSFCAAGP